MKGVDALPDARSAEYFHGEARAIIAQFVSARQLSGHHITISVWRRTLLWD